MQNNQNKKSVDDLFFNSELSNEKVNEIVNDIENELLICIP